MFTRVWNTGARWLCVAAFMLMSTACEKSEPVEAVSVDTYIKPDDVPTYTAPKGGVEHGVKFTDITGSSGIEFTHVTGAFGKKWMPETMGGGGAFFNYDNDGLPDILLINSSYWPGHAPDGESPTSKLYRNRGGGTFEDVTSASGLARLSCYGMGSTIADYDGDGDEDIFVTAVGKNHLLRNDNGRFTDVTDESGVGFSKASGASSDWEWSTGSTWIDYDRDGDLDLFVANYVQWTPETDIWATLDGKTKSYATPQQYQGSTCVLYENQGNGKFKNVTQSAGVHNPKGKSLSAVVDDFNDDGWPDFFVTNDTQPNFLYINNTDGSFTDHALSAGVAYDENGLARAGMGVSITDVTNSGVRSIGIGNFSGEPISLYTQAGVGTFIDRAGATRLSKPTTSLLTFAVLFADLNLDGYDDVIFANGHIEPEIHRVREGWTFAQQTKVYLNDRAGRFLDITDDTGDALTEKIVGRCLATADIDNDGDLDVLVTGNGGSPKLLRNDQTGGGRFVRVRLQGGKYNPSAIGARLRAEIGGMTVTRFITTGGSYLSQSELVATIGLGEAEAIDKLEVRWPDGSIDHFEDLASQHIYTVQLKRGIVNKNLIGKDVPRTSSGK